MCEERKNCCHYLLLIVLSLITTLTQAQVARPVIVSVNKSTGWLEIKNGLLGIAIPKEGEIVGSKLPAPVQSFIYSSGVYSDNTINYLKSDSRLSRMKVSFRKRSDDIVSVQLYYRFDKKLFTQFRKNATAPQAPAGGGYYSCTITMERGKKTIQIEEESDCDISYRTKISLGLSPDKARYRGWASETAPQGYEPDGKPYRAEESRGYPLDATVDLQYDKPSKFPRLILWEPAGGEFNSGRYWQIYNNKADQNSNLLGFFQGPPSRLIGAGGLGPSIQMLPQDTISKENQVAEIMLEINQHWPLDKWLNRKRFQWVVYISTKKDLLSPEKTQPIGQAMNNISGLGAVIRRYAEEPVTLVPGFYKGAIYLTANEMAVLCKRIKEDNKFYQFVCSIESTYKPIWDSWHNTDSAKSLLRQLLEVQEKLLQQYTLGEGTYYNSTRYWKGARTYKFYGLAISALFMDPSLVIQEKDKNRLKQLVGLMAKIVWNDNNAPLFDSAGVNMGPANMPFQYRNNARIFFALILANDPAFKQKAREVPALIQKDLEDAVYANGASFGTPHYTQATIDPILFTILQLKQSGVGDFQKWNNRLSDFARFYCTLNTPPSSRFEGNRKLISFGDGSEESSATFGLLSTLLKNSDPLFSKQLLSIFHKGPAQTSFAGPVMLAVDLTAAVPKETFDFTTANYTGYLSHFRSAANTQKETALWVLNGDLFFDHRNDDAGEMAIYALGAPLSLSRGSFYYPSATDSRIRSVVVPEKLFPEWNGPNQPIHGRSLTNRTWPRSDLNEFANLGYAATTSIQMRTPEGKTWQRIVTAITVNEDKPVFIFYDSVSGKENSIWSMMMMSESAVVTPVGAISPEKRMYSYKDIQQQQLPTATPVRSIPAGWNRFAFNGQSWKKHISGGIDWYLYTNTSRPVNFTLSQWGTNWLNVVEAAEFRKSNGREYTEEQQILRLQNNEPFFSVLLPFTKGDRSYEGTVTTLPGKKIQVKQGMDILTIGDAGIVMKKGNSDLLALLRSGKKIDNGRFFVEGGIMGLEYSKNKLVIRVHGKSGIRMIRVPFGVVRPQAKYGDAIIKSFQGNTTITIDYNNNKTDLPAGQKGYKEYIFVITE